MVDSVYLPLSFTPSSMLITAGLSFLSYFVISTILSCKYHKTSRLLRSTFSGTYNPVFVAGYRLRHIPGPPLASFSYFWQLRAALSGKRAELYRNVNEKYGSLARIGPNELLTDDPKLIMHMSAARAPYTRSTWYSGFKFNPYTDNLVNILDTGAHDRLRAKLASGYSMKDNPTLESSVDEQLESLIKLIRSRYISDGDRYRPLGNPSKLVIYLSASVI